MIHKEQTEQQKTLADRLQANHQRNERRQYLAELPAELQSYLSKQEFLPIAEFKAVAPHFRIRPEGFGQEPTKPEDYYFDKFSWRHKVLGQIQKLDARHDDKDAYFWIRYDSPIYRVDFGWVRSHLSQLLEDRLGVITTDFLAGLIVDEYCGHIMEDYNPDEVVYQLAIWGFDIKE